MSAPAPTIPAASTLTRWAGDTWRGLAAMTFDSGLPGDGVAQDLGAARRDDRCSPTDIGAWLWSVVAAEGLGLIPAGESRTRCAAAVTGLSRLARHEPSGMFFNWYRASTGEPIPGGRRQREPFVSAVDNGWLAAALMVVSEAVPGVRAASQDVLGTMNFGVFVDPAAGCRLRGGFWLRRTRRQSVRAAYLPGVELEYTRHHYDLLNSEPRIAGYVGMVLGQLPASYYGALVAPRRTYAGLEVAATLGGTMFEALSPALFVPEEVWAPQTWGRNHADTIAAHRAYAADKRYRYWGFSPAACPPVGGRASYAELGVPPISLFGEYPSERCGEGVVAPHAAALAMIIDPDPATENLSCLERELGCYGPGGFLDSVGVRSARTPGRYLMLDQAMFLAALNQSLGASSLRTAFATERVRRRLAPLVYARAMS